MNILVFQHLDVEHPGVFRDFWQAAGHTWTPVELDAGEPIPDDLTPFDLLVAMGGPMDVWQEDEHPWLIPEKRAIRTWVQNMGRPYLGICLGHQLLADALGGAVGLMKTPEVGFADMSRTKTGRTDPLLRDFPDRFETFQWHGAAVQRVPDGAEILAANDACPIQAIRWGRYAYGFQYHVEITPTTVPDWQAIPAYAASLEAALGPEEAAHLEGAVATRLPAFRVSAQRLNDALLALVDEAAIG